MSYLITLPKNGSSGDGYLTYFESNKDIPFNIKRIYYIYQVHVNSKRGMHAHKKLQQVLWCPYGSIEVILDNGKTRDVFVLDSPNNILLVLEGYWHDMIWLKEGSILCVAASDFYNENDYIRDYDEFLRYVGEGYWDDDNQF